MPEKGICLENRFTISQTLEYGNAKYILRFYKNFLHNQKLSKDVLFETMKKYKFEYNTQPKSGDLCEDSFNSFLSLSKVNNLK